MTHETSHTKTEPENTSPVADKPRKPVGSRRMARESGKVEATAPQPRTTPARTSKIDIVKALLRRAKGATLDELVEATGWQPHSTRAALTGLRKKGHAIEKTKRDEVTCYRITDAA